MPNKEDIIVNRIVKGIKWGGGLLFLAVNTFLIYNYATAYQDGKRRGEILHQQKE